MADPGENLPRSDKLWREFRVLMAVVLVLGVLVGGYQLWELVLAPHSTPVELTAQTNPTFSGQSTAEWLLPRLAANLVTTRTSESLLQLPPGTTRGTLKVRGRSKRREMDQNGLDAILSYPDSDREILNIRLRPTATGDALAFVLSEDAAEEYCGRMVRTFVAIRDQQQNPVRDLTSREALPFDERSGQASVYDIGLPLENLLFVLEGDGVFPYRVSLGDHDLVLEVPANLFLREVQESHVVDIILPRELIRNPTVAAPEPEAAPSPTQTSIAESQPTNPEPTGTRPPPDTAPPTPQPPAPDPAELAAQRMKEECAATERAVEMAVRRGNWDRAQTELRALADLGAPAATLARLETSIREGRDEEAQLQQVATLAGRVDEQLGNRDWDNAEATMAQLTDLVGDPPRLAEWTRAIREGRQADALAAQPEPTPPVPEPTLKPADDRKLIEETLATFERSQNDRNLALYTSVYPTVDSKQRDTLEQAWSEYRSFEYELNVQSVDVQNQTGTARCQQRIRYVPKRGNAGTSEIQIDVSLCKADDRWTIQSVTPVR